MIYHPVRRLDRRGFIQLAAAGAGFKGGLSLASSKPPCATRAPTSRGSLVGRGAPTHGGLDALLDQVESTVRAPLRPQRVIRAVSDLMADDAVISLDCGANTHFAARCMRLKANQRLTGTGMLASMAPGVSFAIAAPRAYPHRRSVAVDGDAGFAMLMAELTTAVAYDLPVKIIVLINNSLAEVSFEQHEIGNPDFGCDLAPIDCVALCAPAEQKVFPVGASGGAPRDTGGVKLKPSRAGRSCGRRHRKTRQAGRIVDLTVPLMCS